MQMSTLPSTVIFPDDVVQSIGEETAQQITNTIFWCFDKITTKMIATGDKSWFLANIIGPYKFPDDKQYSVYVEYVFHINHPEITVTVLRWFPPDLIPDEILERATDLSKDPEKKHFTWGEGDKKD